MVTDSGKGKALELQSEDAAATTGKQRVSDPGISSNSSGVHGPGNANDPTLYSHDSLLEEVERGDIVAIKAILAAGVDVNAADICGQTALHIAAESRGDGDVLRILLDAGVRIDAVDMLGNTALHAAVLKHNTDAVRFLLNVGANADLSDGDGMTVLHLASKDYAEEHYVEIGYVEIVDALINAGADLNKVNGDGDAALHIVLKRQSTRAVAIKVLLHAGANPNIVDRYGNTALHSVIFNRYDNRKLVILQTLLAAGASPNTINSRGDTPLHSVLKSNHATGDEIQALLAAGANVDTVDKLGDTALHLAIEKLNAVIVQKLVAAGANTNIANRWGQTPLYLIWRMEYSEWKQHNKEHMLKVLLAAGATIDFDIDEVNDDHRTGLYQVNYMTNYDVTKLVFRDLKNYTSPYLHIVHFFSDDLNLVEWVQLEVLEWKEFTSKMKAAESAVLGSHLHIISPVAKASNWTTSLEGQNINIPLVISIEKLLGSGDTKLGRSILQSLKDMSELEFVKRKRSADIRSNDRV